MSAAPQSLRVIVTGSRHADASKHHDFASVHIFQEIENYCVQRGIRIPRHCVTIIHGAAAGIDTIAGNTASQLGLKVETFPADWKRYGKAAGPVRNQQMVDAGADLCIGFPSSLGNSYGTNDCLRRARQAGVTTIVIDNQNLF